jgi:hypothetical protein
MNRKPLKQYDYQLLDKLGGELWHQSWCELGSHLWSKLQLELNIVYGSNLIIK